MFNDTSRAYMHARKTSDIYVELCEEDKCEPGEEHRCGKLVKSMYGTRGAAHDWQSEVTGTSKAEHPCACAGIGKETLTRWDTATISSHPAKGRNSNGYEDDHGGRGQMAPAQRGDMRG